MTSRHNRLARLEAAEARPTAVCWIGSEETGEIERGRAVARRAGPPVGKAGRGIATAMFDGFLALLGCFCDERVRPPP